MVRGSGMTAAQLQRALTLWFFNQELAEPSDFTVNPPFVIIDCPVQINLETMAKELFEGLNNV
jgi:hypothetical protein